jgi:hypothetical protein
MKNAVFSTRWLGGEMNKILAGANAEGEAVPVYIYLPLFI